MHIIITSGKATTYNLFICSWTSFPWILGIGVQGINTVCAHFLSTFADKKHKLDNKNKKKNGILKQKHDVSHLQFLWSLHIYFWEDRPKRLASLKIWAIFKIIISNHSLFHDILRKMDGDERNFNIDSPKRSCRPYESWTKADRLTYIRIWA